MNLDPRGGRVPGAPFRSATDNLDLIAYTFLIYRALTSQMAGLLDAKVSDVIFSSVVPVVVTSQVEQHV